MPQAAYSRSSTGNLAFSTPQWSSVGWAAAPGGSAEIAAGSRSEQPSGEALSAECQQSSANAPPSLSIPHPCSPGLWNAHPGVLHCPAEPSPRGHTHPTCLQPPGEGEAARGTVKGIELTGHREISSHLSAASQSQSSCCCSSSAPSGRGSWTRSGCTLQGERWSKQAGPSHGPAPSQLQLVSAARGTSRCLGHQPRASPSLHTEDEDEGAIALCRAPAAPKLTPHLCKGT